MPIQTAASAKKVGKAQRTLAHLEIHPALGSGHMVRHVYAGFGHEPKETKFNSAGRAQGGEHILDHIKKYAGLQEHSVKEPAYTESRISAPTEGED